MNTIDLLLKNTAENTTLKMDDSIVDNCAVYWPGINEYSGRIMINTASLLQMEDWGTIDIIQNFYTMPNFILHADIFSIKLLLNNKYWTVFQYKFIIFDKYSNLYWLFIIDI